MANVNEGLSNPPANESVNTLQGFEAALASKGAGPEEGEQSTPSTDTSVASGLEVVDPAAAQRGPDGRYTATTDTPAANAETSTGTEGGIAFTSDDPEIRTLLEKYNGDPEEALRAAVQAQSLIGRRDEERDTLREQVAELRGMVQALQTTTTAAAPAPVLSDEQVEEHVAGLIQRGGYLQAATDAANASIQPGGDERAYKSVIEQWQLEQPFEAMNHVADFRAWQREQARAAEAPVTGRDPWALAQEGQAHTNEAVAKVAGEWGEQWSAIAPHMIAALEAMPKNVAEMISSTDPEARVEGTRLVADRAARLAQQAGATNAAASEQAAAAAVQRKLAGAAVASSSLRPAAAVPGQEKTREEELKGFKDAILAAETTSVASGLTYGPAR